MLGRPLLQDLAEAPLGEDPLAGGDRQMRAAGDVGQHVDILALDGLFDEERLIRLQGLDQQLRRLRRMTAPWKSTAMSTSGPTASRIAANNSATRSI